MGAKAVYKFILTTAQYYIRQHYMGCVMPVALVEGKHQEKSKSKVYVWGET